MRNSYILSTGSYAPENVIPNSFFDRHLGENVSDWLEEVVQIHERRWCSEQETTSDLCSHAAQRCLRAAGIEAGDLDLIIVATDTPDYISPSTASVVQHKLRANRAGTFDLNTACAGFVTALDVGSKYIKSDPRYEHILIIGAYAMSKHLDKMDKKTVTLFADGAGAVLLGATHDEGRGFLASELRSMGEYNGWMGIYGGGATQPASEQSVSNKEHKLRFVHKFPKEINPCTWSDMAIKLNEQCQISSQEVDQYFITQININSIWETLEILGVPRGKAHTIMHNFGYTGSACIPMALDDALKKNVVSSGDLVYFIGSGGGLSFASAAFRL